METGLIINPEKLAQIQSFVEVKDKAVTDIVVKDPATMAEATELGQSLKGAINKLETMRKDAVAPLNQQVKEINGKIKFFVEPLESLRETLNRKMITHQQAEMRREELIREEAERKRQEEFDRIEAERLAAEEKIAAAQRKLEQENLTQKQAEAAQRKIDQQQKELEDLKEQEVEQEIAVAMIEPVKKTVRTASGAKATLRMRWTWEVVDAAKVPRDYLCVDERSVKEAISQGVRDIPGIRVFQDAHISQ
jgi:chromosome segregation ATPase